MAEIPGMIRPELQELLKTEDRMTFLYLEHCQLNREDSAITVRDEQGITYVPAAAISVLLLGPGTSVTHRAMELIGDAGVSVVWAGENGVRYYAGGRPLTHRAELLQKQARLVSGEKTHIAVVRKMYSMRFPGEDVSRLTMQQLRGREGSRVRAAYRAASEKWNVPWSGRDYSTEDFNAGDPVNQSLTAGNMCLYGLAHAVIFALGCSPGLGFIHVGHENSFVYDIADLYKAEVVIPLAFELAAGPTEDISAIMRRRTRDAMVEAHLLERMVRDIHTLLNDEANNTESGAEDVDVVSLWDGSRGSVESGISYGKKEGKV